MAGRDIQRLAQPSPRLTGEPSLEPEVPQRTGQEQADVGVCRIGRPAQRPGQCGTQVVQVGFELISPLLLQRTPQSRTRLLREAEKVPRVRPAGVRILAAGRQPFLRILTDRLQHHEPGISAGCHRLEQTLVHQPGDDLKRGRPVA